jgi:hypothetical protein
MIPLPLCTVSDRHSAESGSVLGLTKGIDLFGGPFHKTGRWTWEGLNENKPLQRWISIE